MSDVSIREATIEDVPTLVSLWRMLEGVQGRFRALSLPADAEGRVAATFRAAMEDHDARIRVAEADGRVVAMAMLHIETPSRMSDERAVEIGRVIVDPAYRKRGIANAFIESAEALARERGFRWLSAKIFSANGDAIRFWERAGFTAVYESRVRRVD